MGEFYYEFRKEKTNIGLRQYIYHIGSYHYNWHRDLELLTVLNGEVEVCTGGTQRILQEDDLVLINSNEGHATLAKGSDSIAMVLHLDPELLRGYYENVDHLHFHVCSQGRTNQKEFRRIRRSLARMMLGQIREEHSGLPEAGGVPPLLLFERSLYDLLYFLASDFPPEVIQSAAFQGNQKKMDAITKMIQYINRNYAKKISLDTLAKESGYHPGYVSQLFKSYVGINFYDYLTRIRLREATRALSQSQKKIVDIALEHGFPDLKSFNTNFKENFHKSPTEYRRQLNEENLSNDPHFKKKFLDQSDLLVNKKLEEYAKKEEEKGDEGLGGAFAELKEIAAAQSSRLEKLSQELHEASEAMKILFSGQLQENQETR